MIQRVVTGSSRLRKPGADGHADQRAEHHDRGGLAVGLLPGVRNQRRGGDEIDDQQQRRDQPRRGDAELASGMKISAEPKPENPRAVPETKAIAQIAIATLRLTSPG